MLDLSTAKVLTLFAEFKEEYDGLVDYKAHRYTAQKAKEWAIELLESGVNKEQFNKGAYKAIKQSKYPPDRAYNFIQLCKDGTESEYPDAQTAFDIACKNCGMDAQFRRWDKTHVVVYQTANELGFGKLKTATHGLLKTFTEIYNRVCNEYASGADFALPESHQLSYDDTHKPASADSPVMSQWQKMVANKTKRKEATT